MFGSLWILSSTAHAGNLVDSSKSATETLQRVAAGISTNYAALGAVEIALRTVVEQPEFLAETTITEVQPDGSITTYTVAPRWEGKSRIIVNGPDLYRETLEDDGKITQVDAIVDGKWTQYLPDEGIAWIRRPEQMGSSLLPFDPRDVGASDATRLIPQMLRESGVVDVATSTSGKLIQADLRDELGRKLLFEFDPRIGLLPVRAAYCLPDGSISILIDITYQRIEDRKAWLLDTLTRDTFAPGAVGNLARAPKAKPLAVLRQSVTKVVILDDAANNDSIFRLRLPDGVEVRDQIEKTQYRVGGTKSQ
jgi:hypothetical protein